MALMVNQAYGNTNLLVLEGGLAGWILAGYPVVDKGR